MLSSYFISNLEVNALNNYLLFVQPDSMLISWLDQLLKVNLLLLIVSVVLFCIVSVSIFFFIIHMTLSISFYCKIYLAAIMEIIIHELYNVILFKILIEIFFMDYLQCNYSF